MNYQITPLKPFGVLLQPKNSCSISSLPVKELKDLFHEHALIVIRGFDTFSSSEDFADFCEKFGTIGLWPFGKVLELTEREKPEDHIFDHSYVPMHWDGMYRPQIPEYQIFHCLKAPSPEEGGRTTFSHTALVLKHASEQEKALWEKVSGIYKRKMEFYESTTHSPIITRHPYKDYSVIRYNEPPVEKDFINPPDLTFTGVKNEELDAFHLSLKQSLYDPKNFYAHNWQASDVLIADNFTLLHGREGFSSQAPRHLQRVHVLSETPFNNPNLESYR